MSSYWSFPKTATKRINGELVEQQVMYKEKPIYFGFGYFAGIYHPGNSQEESFWVQLGHLADINNNIPFSKPVKEDDAWTPQNHNLNISPEQMRQMPNIFTWVKKGDLIGKVGFSGLRWGRYEEYQAGADRPTPIDPNKYPSFDDPHIHMEVYRRIPFEKDTKYTYKADQHDPYDIYQTARAYPTHENRQGKLGKDHMFIVDTNGLPIFA